MRAYLFFEQFKILLNKQFQDNFLHVVIFIKLDVCFSGYFSKYHSRVPIKKLVCIIYYYATT